MQRGFPTTAVLCLLAAAATVLIDASPASAKRARHAKEKPIVAPTPRTPADKTDCITLSQAFYGHAKVVVKRAKQSIPREFIRVVSDLDEFCGEEDFDKARITIDWMDTCLKNFSKDDKSGLCSRNKSYFCAIDPRSDGCLTNP
jgi:hypothetical protein